MSDDYTRPDPETISPLEDKPWYNDSDKAGGAAATIIMLSLAVFVAGLIIIALLKIGQAVL